MKLYKIIIFFTSFHAILFAQFTEVLINIDYSNISEKQMFIFENFENEIKSYFTNNYFFDEPDNLDMLLSLFLWLCLRGLGIYFYHNLKYIN